MNSKLLKLDPVVKNRLHEDIVKQIQRKIISGELTAGERLPSERDIAESLHVNRATLREALKKLEMLELVEIRHGDGIYVRDYLESKNLELFNEIIYLSDGVNIDILRHILEVRMILVPEMAYLAAERRTMDDLKEFENIMQNENESVLEKDLKVHHIIGRASKNILYIFILNFFNQLFREYGNMYFDAPENRRYSEKFHREIYEAIGKNQAEKAKKIMKEVLLYTENRIFAYYNENHNSTTEGRK